jgi:heptosyltransferase-2
MLVDGKEFSTSESAFPVKLYPGQGDFAKVSQYKTQRYITIAPGSLWFTKQYPEEKWAEFAASLEKELAIYFLGAPNEKELCDRIIDKSGHQKSLNLAGKLSFLESAALMRDARMNYVNDSAPMHLASSVNAPVTAVYCSTVPEFGFGPLSEESYVIQAVNPPDCKPCGLHGFKKCPEKHFDCAYIINKEQLLEKL